MSDFEFKDLLQNELLGMFLAITIFSTAILFFSHTNVEFYKSETQLQDDTIG